MVWFHFDPTLLFNPLTFISSWNTLRDRTDWWCQDEVLSSPWWCPVPVQTHWQLWLKTIAESSHSLLQWGQLTSSCCLRVRATESTSLLLLLPPTQDNKDDLFVSTLVSCVWLNYRAKISEQDAVHSGQSRGFRARKQTQLFLMWFYVTCRTLTFSSWTQWQQVDELEPTDK